MSLFRLLILLAVTNVLSACSILPNTNRYVRDQPYHITIIHTNDDHGHFWANAQGEYGMAARKTLIDQIRTEVKMRGGYTLVLSGGDINTGVAESDLQSAEPDFLGMDRIGYDAMAIGNHEFDKPITVLKKQQQWIHFPMLAANIYQPNRQRMFEPYTFFNLGGLKVAVLGLTTPDTAKAMNPNNTREVSFTNPITEANTLVPQLRRQADIVIAVTHMGHFPDGQHGVNAPGDVEMARAVNGIDLIVGGHTHSVVCMQAPNVREARHVPGAPCIPDQQNGTRIVQAGEWGKYVGRADFEFKNGKMKLLNYQMIPVNLKYMTQQSGITRWVNYTQPIVENGALRQFLKNYQDAKQPVLNEVVGESRGRFEGAFEIAQRQQVNLAVLIGRMMMEQTQADFAVINSRSIRNSIPSGPITYRTLLNVLPFGTHLAYIDLTGREALEYLQTVARFAPNTKYYAQYAGLQLKIKKGVLLQVLLKGKPFQPDKTYRMAISGFIAHGGDDYPMLSQRAGYTETQWVDVDSLKSYIIKHTPLVAADYAPQGVEVQE